MNSEIERRFLLRELPAGWAAKASMTPIRQGYLIIESGRVLRIRDSGKTCRITVKSGSGLLRQEQEQDISRELFQLLWPLTEGRRNEKSRYSRQVDGALFEIDVFAGALAPLIVLEVEFPSLEAAHAFTPPAFAGREVTEDPRYNNAALALDGLPPDWNQE